MTEKAAQTSPGRKSTQGAQLGDPRATHPLFTKRSLCAYLAISPSTLDRLVGAGKLAAHRIGGQVRFDPDDVREFIAATKE